MIEEITQKQLKDRLNYDPDTGIFTWKVAAAKNIKIGDVAGCVDSKYYITIGMFGRLFRAHRLAFLYMEGEFPPDGVDHINQNKQDNRWSNLRHANQQINCRNSKKSKLNTSGITGVRLNKSTKKYVAEIKVNGKTKHLGTFAELDSAAKERKKADVKYGFSENHGEE